MTVKKSSVYGRTDAKELTQQKYEPGEFSVAQFFEDGTNEYVRRFVSAKEAVLACKHYTHSVGAQIGNTVRVIITDGDDNINFEWKYGEGITYPPPPFQDREP